MFFYLRGHLGHGLGSFFACFAEGGVPGEVVLVLDNSLFGVFRLGGLAFPRALVRARPCSVFLRDFCLRFWVVACLVKRGIGYLERPVRAEPGVGLVDSPLGASRLFSPGVSSASVSSVSPKLLFFWARFLVRLSDFSSASSDLFQAFHHAGGLVWNGSAF